ncbi:hypothetical protein [Kitasatospora sp. NPDC001095]
MSERYWFKSPDPAGAQAAEKNAVATLGEKAGFWTVEMDALPVGYGEWFEPSEDMFPAQEWKQFLVDADDNGTRYWAVKVNLPAGTTPFNPAYLVLDSTTWRLSPQFPTVSTRYMVYFATS